MKPLYVKKNGTVNKVSGVAMPNTYPADRVKYDNTTSELEATNTQDAIDEVVGIVADKVDKVSSATNGNLAGLDASGNLTDSGVSSSTLEAIVNVYGSKNLLKNNASSTYDSTADITWTVNSDGTIVANNGGINSNWSFLGLFNGIVSDIFPKAGQYIITTGIPSDKYNNIRFQLSVNGTLIINMYDGNVTTITVTNEMLSQSLLYAISAMPSIAFENTVIYPMLRDARISDSTYTPYAMTNRELTEKKIDKVVPAASGNLATLDSSGNLTDSGMHPLYLIERVSGIPTQDGGTTIITFSGIAICRVPHYMLLLAGQGGCSSPIIVEFSGQYGPGPIEGIYVSDTLGGLIQTSGTSIIITDGFSGWGDGFMFNLFPQDNVEYTVTRGT